MKDLLKLSTVIIFSFTSCAPQPAMSRPLETEVSPYTIACKVKQDLVGSWVDDFNIEIGDSCRVLANYTPVIVVRMGRDGPVRVRFDTSPVEYYINRGSLL